MRLYNLLMGAGVLVRAGCLLFAAIFVLSVVLIPSFITEEWVVPIAEQAQPEKIP